MSNYQPDNWVVIFLNGDDPHYRVLAGWSGGYTQGDGWRLNSGICRVVETDHTFDFYGSSGSCYSCHKKGYGLRMNNAYIWKQLQDAHGDKVSMLPEDTDWSSMVWILKPPKPDFDIEHPDPAKRSWYYDGDGTKRKKE